jgi:fluoroquinolone resistance protein
MSNNYTENKIFENINYSSSPFIKGEYECCTFINCEFSNVDLSSVNFVECSFIGCNLSLTVVNKTSFKGINFKECKLLGVRYDSCNPFLFAVNFDNCNINHASFYGVNARNTVFDTCTLHEVDFTQTDLSAAIFDNCDLQGATFDRSILDKADVRTARNFIIDPSSNKINKLKISIHLLPNLLSQYNLDISY